MLKIKYRNQLIFQGDGDLYVGNDDNVQELKKSLEESERLREKCNNVRNKLLVEKSAHAETREKKEQELKEIQTKYNVLEKMRLAFEQSRTAEIAIKNENDNLREKNLELSKRLESALSANKILEAVRSDNTSQLMDYHKLLLDKGNIDMIKEENERLNTYKIKYEELLDIEKNNKTLNAKKSKESLDVIARLKEEIKILEKNINEYKAFEQYKNKFAELAKLSKQEISDLRNELSEYTEKYNALEVKNNNRKLKIDNLTMELSNVKNENAEMRGQIKALEKIAKIAKPESAHKGSDFENFILQSLPSNTSNTTQKQNSGDFIVPHGDSNILVECKNYKAPVPKTEVDKFLRDISECNVVGGILFSNGPVANYKNFATFSVKKVRVFIVNISKIVDVIALRDFYDILAELCLCGGTGSSKIGETIDFLVGLKKSLKIAHKKYTTIIANLNEFLKRD